MATNATKIKRPTAKRPEALTKQKITQISTALTELENEFSAMLTYQSNIQKINTATRIASERAIKESAIEKAVPIGPSIDTGGLAAFGDSIGLLNKQLATVVQDLEALDMSSRSGFDPSMGDIPDQEDREKKRKGRRARGRARGRKIGKLGRAGRLIGRAVFSPAGIALGTTVAAGVALESGLQNIDVQARKELEPLKQKYGMTPIQKNGVTVGWDINGQKYKVSNLPEYYKQVLEAEGPGARRGTAPQVRAQKYIEQNKPPSPVVEKPSIVSLSPPTAPSAGTIQATSVAPAPSAGSPAPVIQPPIAGQQTKQPETKAQAGKEQDMEQAIDNAGIKDPLIKAQIMAQTAHESGNFKYTREIWGPTGQQQRYEGRQDLGNVVEGDGYKYRGRGFLQVTGRANYEEMSKEIGVNVVDNPDILSEPKYAAISALVWFKKRWNRFKDWSDVTKVTKIVNGGYNGLEDRMIKFQKYAKKYGVQLGSQEATGAPPPSVAPVPKEGMGKSLEDTSRTVGVEQKVQEQTPIVVVQQEPAPPSRPGMPFVPGAKKPPQSSIPNQSSQYQRYFAV